MLQHACAAEIPHVQPHRFGYLGQEQGPHDQSAHSSAPDKDKAREKGGVAQHAQARVHENARRLL